MRTNAIVVDTSRPPEPWSDSCKFFKRRRRERLRRELSASGRIPAERLAALAQVLHFRAFLGRPVEGRLAHVLFRDRNLEPVRNIISSSFSFFCWCVMLRPSPASPSP